MLQPIRHSKGAAQKDTMIMKMQPRTKVTGINKQICAEGTRWVQITRKHEQTTNIWPVLNDYSSIFSHARPHLSSRAGMSICEPAGRPDRSLTFLSATAPAESHSALICGGAKAARLNSAQRVSLKISFEMYNGSHWLDPLSVFSACEIQRPHFFILYDQFTMSPHF